MKWIYIFLILIQGCASTRIITMNKSYHYDQSKGYNETHNGIGVEYKNKKDQVFGIATFQNSYNDTSTLLSFAQENRITDHWYHGIALGVASGYKQHTSSGFQYIGGWRFRYRFIRLDITPIFISLGTVWEL